MKATLTARSSVDGAGGVNTFIFELSSAMIKMGHEVKIVTFSSRVNKSMVKELFDVEEIPEIISLNPCVEARWPPRGSSMNDLSAWLIRGSSVISKGKPDFIIMNGIVPLVTRSKIIVVCHNIYPCRWYQLVGAQMLYRTVPDHVVCISSKGRDEALKTLKLSPMRVKVIPICIDTKKYRSNPLSEREIAILQVGTYDLKNLPTTIRAFNILAKKVPDVKLYIAGGYTPSVKYSVNLVDRSLRKRVDYLGTISRSSLRKFYSGVRCLIAPSYSEGFPFAALEATASGTPLVTSSALPVEIAVNGFNSLIVQNPCDYEQFANYLFSILTDDSLWRQFSKNALKHAELFDVVNVANQYLNLFKNLN